MTIEERRAYNRRWRAKNPERVKRYAEDSKRWQRENPERHKATIERHHEKHPGAAVRNTRRWQRKHPDKISVLNRTRKALRRARLHPLHDPRHEEAMVIRCRWLTEATGVAHHLDHIIPLNRGGWHHHENLQPLPMDLNIAKSDDPFWEEQGYKSWRDVPEYLWPESLRDIYLLAS